MAGGVLKAVARKEGALEDLRRVGPRIEREGHIHTSERVERKS
jgi:hypothetical protein